MRRLVYKMYRFTDNRTNERDDRQDKELRRPWTLYDVTNGLEQFYSRDIIVKRRKVNKSFLVLMEFSE